MNVEERRFSAASNLTLDGNAAMNGRSSTQAANPQAASLRLLYNQVFRTILEFNTT
jgi:hypothetical protein